MAGEKKIAKDTYIFKEGDQPDAMYIIKSGSFAITKAKGTSEIVLAEIAAGQMVGEMALFDRKPRSANVKALKDSEVIALAYDSLNTQLETLPVWVRAIMKTMNENLREANNKIRQLETASPDGERFPPHVINRLLSIFNMIGMKYGTKEGDAVIVPQFRLRNFTIQVFQEATNKMQSMLSALVALDFVKIEELGEGKQRILNLQPQLLFDFVDWYNDWLFKQEKDRMAALTSEEVKILSGVIHFAKKVPINPKGFHKINVGDIQNESMKELGFLIKAEELKSLTDKKLISEKIMEESGIYVSLHVKEIEPLSKYWKIIWDFKKTLR